MYVIAIAVGLHQLAPESAYTSIILLMQGTFFATLYLFMYFICACMHISTYVRQLNRTTRWRRSGRRNQRTPLRRQILIAPQAGLLVQGMSNAVCAPLRWDAHCTLEHTGSIYQLATL
jgi:hypothetical protein